MSGEVEGSVMFYKSPEPLSLEAHGDVRIKTAEKPFGFAAGEALVPLVIAEIAQACLTYPVIFARGNRFPMAVTGLSLDGGPGGGNLFINAAGLYDGQAYLPAFIRRYPFAAAADPDNRQSITAIIDVAAENVNRTEGEPLFQNGEPTAFTRQTIDFLERYESGVLATVDIIKMYSDLDLFETRNYEIGVNGGARRTALTFEALSADKLANLTAEQLFKLHEVGALAPAHAHLFSLGNLDRILYRAGQQGART